MEHAVRLQGLRKTFGTKVAVDHLDLEIKQGELVGLIGPNGAGKTTSIRMLMSILFPDSGTIEVLGKSSAILAKDRIGYLPEERGVYRKMRVGGFIEYMAKLKGIAPGPTLRSRITDWLERVELGDCLKKRCEDLSKGMQQKVQFIATIIHDPELIILDEPFSGLDPVNMRLLRDLFLEQHNAGKTMIFSTHVMHQAEQLCDRIAMISDGRLVLDDSLTSVRRRETSSTVLVNLDTDHTKPTHDEVEQATTKLTQLSCVNQVHTGSADTETKADLLVTLNDGSGHADAIRAIASTVEARRVELKELSLEEVFIRLAKSKQPAHELAGVSA
ncbi:MAG: ATP-binding cassette domain-containing protein [Phycisphaeraceae bacterium]|nr:ATP-binding cassette domain-containing protein [Phycisphaerales bacterium]MCB9860637.1 ATP-binding cassette domain-containing protein [Phycisphaeraceae bacterium]